MDYSASGGVGEEGLSVVDSEAGERKTTLPLEVFITYYSPSISSTQVP